MVTFEEIDGKLVPKGNEEDIKAYLAYKKGQNRLRTAALCERDWHGSHLLSNG